MKNSFKAVLLAALVGIAAAIVILSQTKTQTFSEHLEQNENDAMEFICTAKRPIKAVPDKNIQGVYLLIAADGKQYQTGIISLKLPKQINNAAE